MVVSVFSAMTGKSWIGEVPSPTPQFVNNALERLFRYFNRVDENDLIRLNRDGYDLPSLTTGDLLGFVENDWSILWYLLTRDDWKRLTPAQAFSYMNRAIREREADRRPPLFAEVTSGGNLEAMVDEGTLVVTKSGFAVVAARTERS